MLKRIIIFALFLLLFFNTYSQKHQEDVVYLLNGGVVRGKIITNIPDSLVKIQSIGGNIWVFKYEEIQSISKENKYGKKTGFSGFQKGYFNITSLGFLTGGNNYYGDIPISLQTTNGYNFPKRYSLALSSGFEYLNIPYVPFMLEGRYYLLDRSISPFFAMQAGYSLPLTGKARWEWDFTYTGGYILNFEIGSISYLNDNTAFIFSAGYRRQEMNSWRYLTDIDGIQKRLIIYNRFNIRLGFLFR